MRRISNPFISLPFVKKRKMPTGRGYDFWCPDFVPETEAREQGRRYGLAYLRFEAVGMLDSQGAILGFILEDMIAKGDTGQVAKGFLYTLAETIAYCAMNPAFLDEIRLRQGDLS